MLASWWTLWRSDLSGLLAYALLFWQDNMIAFAQWIDDFAPADPGAQPQVFVVTTSLSYLSWFHVVRTSFLPWWTLRATYATSPDKLSLVRPWMLSFRRDFGVSSMIEPDVGSLLLQEQNRWCLSLLHPSQDRIDPTQHGSHALNPVSGCYPIQIMLLLRSSISQQSRTHFLRRTTRNWHQGLAEVPSLLSIFNCLITLFHVLVQ